MLLLGSLKYPGQGVLMQPCSGIAPDSYVQALSLALGSTGPQSTHRGLSPLLPFSLPHLHAALCLQSQTHTQGPQVLAQFSKISYAQGFGPCSPGFITKSHQQLPVSWKFPTAQSPSWGHHSLIARNVNYLLNRIFKQKHLRLCNCHWLQLPDWHLRKGWDSRGLGWT